MRAREFELSLAGLTPRTAADLDTRMRKLREARMLPTGGRGPRAPDIEPAHAATILIACAASRAPADAAEAVLLFSPLVPWGSLADSFGGNATFAEAIEAALAKPDVASRILSVELTLPMRDGAGRFGENFPAAVIRSTNANGESVIAAYIPEATAARLRDFQPGHFGGASMRDVTVIGGGLIHQLAIDLHEHEDAGWTGAGYKTDDELKERAARVAAAEKAVRE